MRRLRRTPALRRLVAEARLSVDDLVAPLFVKEGIDAPEPVASMPGVVQHTQESLRKEVRALADLGVPAVMLFGVPAREGRPRLGRRRPRRRRAGRVAQPARRGRRRRSCSWPTTASTSTPTTATAACSPPTARSTTTPPSSGTRRSPIAQADAGADVVAPSGMMDGQVGAIRAALDEIGHADTAILAYAAKYASAFYGPFRDAAECAPQFGDRRGYQMDPPNAREALDETALDVDEGADMVMVKPALAYLDVVARVRDAVRRAGGGVPRERRVRDGEGRRGPRLARRRRRRARGAHRRSSGPAPTSCSRTSRTRARRTPARELAVRRARAGAHPRRGRLAGAGVRVGRRRAVLRRAAPRAPYLVDTDGRRYVDYVQSWGASILGHAHPAVVEAVQRAAADGTSYGAPTEREVELAEAIAARVPSVEKVRLVSSGTEAAHDRGPPRPRRDRPAEDPEVRRAATTATSTRCSSPRAAASPPSACPARPASPRAPSPTPWSCPTTTTRRSTTRSTATAPSSRRCSSSRWPPTWAWSPPADGFLAGLRRRCTDAGALLVFDEVITGFRVGPAGAQGRYGITPDLSMFGKVIGGGLPLAAVGGRADVMDELAPLGPVYQAGTLSGNPLATAAGLAVLSRARRRRLRRARGRRPPASPTGSPRRCPRRARSRRSAP